MVSVRPCIASEGAWIRFGELNLSRFSNFDLSSILFIGFSHWSWAGVVSPCWASHSRGIVLITLLLVCSFSHLSANELLHIQRSGRVVEARDAAKNAAGPAVT